MWKDSSPGARLRIGIINIMPRAEAYEGYLTRPLLRAQPDLEVHWIKLESHAYRSSNREHIARHYRTFEATCRDAELDGLVLTGAPVEHLEFREVHYWTELAQILTHARRRISSTLGLCWGGLALAHLLGAGKQALPRKLFGAFRNRKIAAQAWLGQEDEGFWCAHSRHSTVPDRDLEFLQRTFAVNLLSHGEETGYSVFESTDRRFLGHLGHPEYEASRIVLEWERDSSLGRSDVEAPKNFDLQNPTTLWRSHCDTLFRSWVDYLAEQRRARPACAMPTVAVEAL